MSCCAYLPLTLMIIVAGTHSGISTEQQTWWVKEPGKLELVFTPDGGGEVQKWEVHQFDGPGVGMGMYNIEESIKGFAKASFEYALDKKWYATCSMAFCNLWCNLGCTLFAELQSDFATCTASPQWLFVQPRQMQKLKLILVSCMHLRYQLAMMGTAQPVATAC